MNVEVRNQARVHFWYEAKFGALSDIEILSLSPDGRYQVQATPWEAGNSQLAVSRRKS